MKLIAIRFCGYTFIITLALATIVLGATLVESAIEMFCVSLITIIMTGVLTSRFDRLVYNNN